MPRYCKECSSAGAKKRKRASFGPHGGKPTRCGKCKIDSDVDVVSRFCDCGASTQPLFGPPGGKPIRCSGCRKPEDVNLVNRRCEHRRQRHQCAICVPIEKMLTSGRWCHGCTATQLSLQRRRAGIKLCATCDATAPKRIELIIRPLLVDAVGFQPSLVDDTIIGGSSCDTDKRRPDLCWIGGDRVVIGEVDEGGGHPDRDPSCELARMWDLTISFKKLRSEATAVFFVRLNSDAFDGARVDLESRATAFGKVVKLLLTEDLTWLCGSIGGTPAVPHVTYLFYHSRCAFQIEAARAASDSFIVMFPPASEQ